MTALCTGPIVLQKGKKMEMPAEAAAASGTGALAHALVPGMSHSTCYPSSGAALICRRAKDSKACDVLEAECMSLVSAEQHWLCSARELLLATHLLPCIS